MTDLDTSIRLMAVGSSLLLLAVLLAGRVRMTLKVPLTGLVIGAAAYLLNASPAFSPESTFDPFVDYLSLLTPFWTWLFARHLFERVPPWSMVWGFMTFYTVCWIAGTWFPATRPWGFIGIHVTALLMVFDLLYTAWSGRSDDLIEKRRLIRLWLPILVGAQAGSILAVELVVGSAVTNPFYLTVNAVLIWALTLFCGIALLETNAELLVDTDGTPAQPAAPTLSPGESVLADKLATAMSDGFYRTPGLTIASLADHLETPEHRLRALINQRLGHRNFSSYLNRHRINEAKAAFADRGKVDLPILTIAMDLGYNSLPTFNRAFRSETDQTPTDFRRLAIGDTAAD